MKDDTLLPLLVSLIDDTSINRLLASLSFAAVERVSRTWDYIERHKAENTWLRDISDTTLRHAFRKSILRWIGNGHSDLTEEVSVGRLLQALHEELGRTGNAGNENEKEIEKLAAAIRTETPSLTYPLDAERLTGILKDTARSEAYKRMLLMTLAKEQPELLIGWLRSEARKDDTLLPLLAPLIADDGGSRQKVPARPQDGNPVAERHDGYTTGTGIAEIRTALDGRSGSESRRGGGNAVANILSESDRQE